jgi:hypothetical protein
MVIHDFDFLSSHEGLPGTLFLLGRLSWNSIGSLLFDLFLEFQESALISVKLQLLVRLSECCD